MCFLSDAPHTHFQETLKQYLQFQNKPEIINKFTENPALFYSLGLTPRKVFLRLHSKSALLPHNFFSEENRVGDKEFSAPTQNITSCGC